LVSDRNVAVELPSAAEPYMEVGVVLAAGLLLVAIGLVGLARLPASVRRPAASVLVIGVVLAVGPHPFTDPSPLWSSAADNPTSAISLALRSSTRAAPLVVLVLALGAGAAASCARQWSIDRSWGDRRALLAPTLIVVLAVVNLPALFTGRLVDPVLERPENVPTAWTDAARFLDARLAAGHDGAVLLVPGIESAAYRWGYPVDPILPALTDKRFVSRDWLPLGSAPYMDALYAFDDAFQEGRLDPVSIAPMARLLGADTVMVVNSHQYERFGTIRPERAALLMGDDPPGLTRLADFGSPSINLADRFWSADQILAPSRALPEISLWSVDDPSPPVRVSTEPTWVRADGTGLVDAASAGLIDGRNVVLDPASFDSAIGDASNGSSSGLPIGPVVVTDSSRRRAHHWRSSQEVWGATESETGVVSIVDVYDQRLPLTSFGPAETIVRAEAIEAVATGYGAELSYWPEYRPAMALDGDPHTAWLVGDERDPRGHVLTITSDAPLGSLALERATERDRWVTVVEIRADDGAWIRQQLDDTTNIVIDPPASRIDIRVAEIAWNDGATASHGDAVGFREVLPIELRRPEVIRVAPLADGLTVNAFVFTRLVADPVDDWRHDPEHRLVREFTVPGDLDVDVEVTAHLSARASTGVVAELFGLRIPTADESVDHLVGHQAWASWSAHDGDPTTAWWSAVDGERPTLVVPVEGPSDSLVIVQPDSSPRVRRVLVSDGSGVAREVDVSPDGRIDFDPIEGDRLEIVVVEAEERLHLDRRTGRSLRHPIGIAEVTGASIQPLDRMWATECRDDLIEFDGEPLSIRLRGRVDELLGGAPFDVEVCSDDVVLDEGVHRLETASGLITGVDVDRIVFTATDRLTGTTAAPVPTETSRTTRSFTVPPCSNECVVEGFDGWSTGWSNDPRPSAVGRNVWIVEPSASPRDFGTEWRPQSLMWIGLATSGLALIAIIATAGLRERRRRSAQAECAAHETPTFSMSPPARSPRASTTLAVVLVTVALTVSPAWSIVPIACFAVARFVGRRVGIDAPTLTGRVGLVLVLLGLLFVIAQQIRTGAAPGFGWPSVFARAHQPVLAGLVMWGASLALGREPSR
jgi:arabinofuranan 3-O-arabinosyltransferase